MKNITDDFFPFIAFKKNGEASCSQTDQIEYVDDFRKETSKIDKSKFNEYFSEYVIIVKELNAREKEERSGHWFSAFKKSKWIYVQL